MGVLKEATSSAFDHNADTFISDETINIDAAGLLLMLVPKKEMTWRMWSTALWGMRMAVKDHQMFFEWNFGVIYAGHAVGLGFLGYGDTRVVENTKK